MPENSYVLSAIFCDEVRTENTGKEIAIGIYPGRLSVPVMPIVLPSLTLRFELFFDGSPVESFSIKIVDPAGNTLIEQQRPMNFSDWHLPGTLSIILQGLILSATGSYAVMTKTSRDDWALQRMLVIEKFDPIRAQMHWRDQMSKMHEGLATGTAD